MIDKIKELLGYTPKKKERSFYDLTSKERKRIIRKAVHGSNEMQARLMKKYKAAF